jgi:hypothetical protein
MAQGLQPFRTTGINASSPTAHGPTEVGISLLANPPPPAHIWACGSPDLPWESLPWSEPPVPGPWDHFGTNDNQNRP